MDVTSLCVRIVVVIFKIQLAFLIRILPNTFFQFFLYIPEVLNGVLISPRGIKWLNVTALLSKS